MRKNLMVHKFITTIALLTAASAVFSYNIQKTLKQGHGTVQLGGYWSLLNKTQHININGLIGDDFKTTHSDNGSGLFGVGYYIDGPNVKTANMTYGMNWFYLAKTSSSGTVTQESLFTNLYYSYNVTHYPLYVMAKSALPVELLHRNLTIDVGIGPNFMTTGHFQEKSIGANTLPDNIFSGTTTTTFSATVGAGVQFNDILGKAPLECGYRFFYLGQGNFNKRNNQVLNNLNTGSVYANALMCSIII